MPILSTVIGLGIAAASAGAGISGAVSSHNAAKQQGKALTIEEQIAQQEQADKQQTFKQLTDFFTPYLKSGSPFLQNIQSAAAGQTAQQTNNAAGQFREEMGQSGAGYGPSGATAAGLANIGAGAANTSASNYLANLLNNEQVKFQAAQGINAAGTMAGSTQNQPNVGVQLQPQSGASAIGAFGQTLQNLLKSLPQGNSSVPGGPGGGSLPLGNQPFNPLTPGFNDAPTTSGWSGTF